jgi:hypothetical protein
MWIQNKIHKKVDYLKLAKMFSEPAPIPKVKKIKQYRRLAKMLTAKNQSMMNKTR